MRVEIQAAPDGAVRSSSYRAYSGDPAVSSGAAWARLSRSRSARRPLGWHAEGVTTGYFAPHSPTRLVIGDPAALVGGISALYLQALHPRAMAGVLEHSSFPDDFWPRL